MQPLPKEYQLLVIIRNHLNAFLPSRSSVEVRSSDLYNYASKYLDFSNPFPNNVIFNQFLRAQHQSGLMKQVIPNYRVDDTVHQKYQWYFFKESRPLIRENLTSDEILDSGQDAFEEIDEVDTNARKMHDEFTRSMKPFKLGISIPKSLISLEDQELLEKNGSWLEAIENGNLPIISEQQQHFLDVVMGKKTAETRIEKAWVLYKKRKNLFESDPSYGKQKHSNQGNSFYSDADYNKMHPEKRRK